MTTASTDWKEVTTPDEEARYLRGAEFLRELQRKRDATGRGLHLKPNLGLTAELVINDNLPEPARHGLGAKPGRYPAYVRFSNGAGARQHDKKGDIRGLAIKVVGVEGKKVIPGMENARTQDFLVINHPITAVRNADEFLAIVRGLQTPALLPIRLVASVGFGRAIKILSQAAKDVGVKVPTLAANTYFTAAPIKWGRYAVKVSFKSRVTVDPNSPRGSSATYLADELTERVKAGPLTWDMQLQFYSDPESTPIELNDVVWKGDWINIGTLTLPQQDPTSERGRKVSAFIEQASFDPWHALVEHQPIGNMMRARNVAYRLSTQLRSAAKEPDGSETF